MRLPSYVETLTGGIVRGHGTSRKRTYDTEFREGAARIVTETGKPIPEVAEDPGIHPRTLHSWVSRARRNGSPLGRLRCAGDVT
ncbi:transposase [Streptomyces sp. MAI_2237]